MARKKWSDFMDYCRCGHPGLGCYCWTERAAEADEYYAKYLETLSPDNGPEKEK